MVITQLFADVCVILLCYLCLRSCLFLMVALRRSILEFVLNGEQSILFKQVDQVIVAKGAQVID